MDANPKPDKISRRSKNLRWVLAAALVIFVLSAVAIMMTGERSTVIAQGKVILTPELVSQGKGAQRLFIIVRDQASQRPMPWGALDVKVSADLNESVYDFTLTKDNMRIMGGDPTPPDVLAIKARLDMDGYAGPDSPGDIVGSLSNVKSGTQNLEIILSELVDESMAMSTSEDGKSTP